MKKLFTKFFLITILLFSFHNYSFATITINSEGSISSENNINITTEDSGTDRLKSNTAFKTINAEGDFFSISKTGEKGIKNLILNLARDLKVLLFSVVLVLGIIVVLKLIFGKGGDEELKKLKNWIIYLTIGIIVIQSSTAIYKLLFDKDINSSLATRFGDNLLQPIIDLFYTAAAFIFIYVAIFSFYKIVTANGDEGKIKTGKTAIIQALIGFIVIKFANIMVKNTYRPICDDSGIIKTVSTEVCEDVTENAKIIIDVINWANGFVAIIIILMTIYAGFLYITSYGDDDKKKKARNILLYIAIGMLVLVSDYLILTFFIYPN